MSAIPIPVVLGFPGNDDLAASLATELRARRYAVALHRFRADDFRNIRLCTFRNVISESTNTTAAALVGNFAPAISGFSRCTV